MAYYNENDPKAAAWLRELIAEGLIAPGEVDERSIEDVRPAELMGYTQCHFFAGIGGWSYALRLAGWPDDRPVWTGSCPCQPFSQAGAGAGTDDPRHLWPAFRWLIDQCRPVAVFGEQVASKAGRGWFSGVRADLDILGYDTGAADLCAAGVGAPHIRQRLYWVANADRRGWRAGKWPGESEQFDGAGEAGGLGNSSRPGTGRDTRSISGQKTESPGKGDSNGRLDLGAVHAGSDGRMANPESSRRGRRTDQPGRQADQRAFVGRGGESGGADGRLGHSGCQRLQGQHGRGDSKSTKTPGTHGGLADTGQLHEGRAASGKTEGRGASSELARRGERGSGMADTDGRDTGTERQQRSGEFGLLPQGGWDSAIWIPCENGKARRIEPSIEPLAHGVSGRVGLLRGYGNAIVPQVAAEFIMAALRPADFPTYPQGARLGRSKGAKNV